MGTWPQPSRPRLSGSGALAPAARTHGPVNATGLFAQRRCNSDFTARQPPPGFRCPSHPRPPGAAFAGQHRGQSCTTLTRGSHPLRRRRPKVCRAGLPAEAFTSLRLRPRPGASPSQVRATLRLLQLLGPFAPPQPVPRARVKSHLPAWHAPPVPCTSPQLSLGSRRAAAESRALTVGAWRSPRPAWGWGAGCSDEGDRAPPRIEPRGCRAAWHSPGPRGSPPSPPPPPLSEQLCAQRRTRDPLRRRRCVRRRCARSHMLVTGRVRVRTSVPDAGTALSCGVGSSEHPHSARLLGGGRLPLRMRTRLGLLEHSSSEPEGKLAHLHVICIQLLKMSPDSPPL